MLISMARAIISSSVRSSSPSPWSSVISTSPLPPSEERASACCKSASSVSSVATVAAAGWDGRGVDAPSELAAAPGTAASDDDGGDVLAAACRAASSSIDIRRAFVFLFFLEKKKIYRGAEIVPMQARVRDLGRRQIRIAMCLRRWVHRRPRVWRLRVRLGRRGRWLGQASLG